MPTPLIPLTINNPGFKGLNSQSSATTLDVGWATELNNAVFDLTGRAVSRKGWTKLTTSGNPGAYDIQSIFCFETTSGTSVVCSAYNGTSHKIYSGTTTLTDRTGTITAPSASHWKFVTLNGYIVGFQNGHAPIEATGIANFANQSAVAGYTAPSSGDLNGGVAISAFGRLWASDSDGVRLHWSGSALDRHQWADADGGGSINTRAYWPNGNDFITGLAVWEDKLVVFGRHNILVYDSPEDPSNIALVDTIAGVGCIARDSIAEVGTDVLFLSETGVRSLKKTFITTKAPVEDISAAVRDLLAVYAAGSGTRVRACYNQREGLYILLFPQTSTTDIFCFDVKNLQQYQQLPTLQGVRVSQWTGFGRCNCLAYGRDEVMYGGFRDETDTDDGVIGKYDGFLDNTQTYTFSYWSPWMDMASENVPGTFYKIPKKATVTTAGGGSYQVIFKWAFDFSDVEYVQSENVITNSELVEWGSTTSEWGDDEWNSSNVILSTSNFNLSGYGQFVRFGVSFVVNDIAIALQTINVFIKQGRLSR